MFLGKDVENILECQKMYDWCHLKAVFFAKFMFDTFLRKESGFKIEDNF